MSDLDKFNLLGVEPLNDTDVDIMKDTAIKMGASPDFVAECLQKYGPDVLSTVTEGLRNGFSISFILESFRLFGPFVMDFLISLLSKQKMAVNLQEQQQVGMTKMERDVLESLVLDANNDKISSNLLKIVVEKLLPYIFEKYGPKIINALVDAIEKAIDEDR
jgi:hypothetical protein